MGLAIAFGLAAAVLLGLLLAGRCSRAALELVLVALLVGIAGYGWQGHPDLPGRPFAATGQTP
ncbi:MAG: hypothetical protein KGM93_07450 [Sphingomonadales bacterium]|nr:hypothetical protein [Sphingomonadales bacterium]